MNSVCQEAPGGLATIGELLVPSHLLSTGRNADRRPIWSGVQMSPAKSSEKKGWLGLLWRSLQSSKSKCPGKMSSPSWWVSGRSAHESPDCPGKCFPTQSAGTPRQPTFLVPQAEKRWSRQYSEKPRESLWVWTQGLRETPLHNTRTLDVHVTPGHFWRVGLDRVSDSGWSQGILLCNGCGNVLNQYQCILPDLTGPHSVSAIYMSVAANT